METFLFLGFYAHHVLLDCCRAACQDKEPWTFALQRTRVYTKHEGSSLDGKQE